MHVLTKVLEAGSWFSSVCRSAWSHLASRGWGGVRYINVVSLKERIDGIVPG